MFKKEAEKILKYKELNNRNTQNGECENKSGTSDNWDNWNHLRIIQKIPEQHTGTTRHQVATDNGLTGHWARTAGSVDVKVQNIEHWK